MKLLRILNFLLFPPYCEVCGRLLTEGEEIMCTACYLDIPRTGFQWEENNDVARVFWGRVYVRYATSYFFFEKGSRYQGLLHKLKYKHRDDIGLYLGRIFGAELLHSVFETADLLIPVPLHPKKQKKRGYNQSEMIAKGISAIIKKPVRTGLILRTEHTETQTKKNRFERFQNMQGKFHIPEDHMVRGKKVLLIDDVVTTGSTLEACSEVLLRAGAEVMIATLGVA